MSSQHSRSTMMVDIGSDVADGHGVDTAADRRSEDDPTRWSRERQRALISCTPPAPVMLKPPASEDAAIRHLRDHREVVTARLDDRTRRTSDLPAGHHGAVRLFDQGLLELSWVSPTQAGWTWVSPNAEASGLRRLRWRTLGFLPYNLGYHEHTPQTMSGAELSALLVWHFRHTSTRWIDVHATDAADLTVTLRDTTGAVLDVDWFSDPGPLADFAQHTRHIPVHRDDPRRSFERRVVHALLANLALRVAPGLFDRPAVTLDLNTWHLRPYQDTPTRYTDLLPLDVQEALVMLDAPDFTDHAAFAAWAEQALTVTLVCRTSTQSREGQAGHRHTVRLDPHTGEASTVPARSVEAQHDLDAHHLLAALSGEDTRCFQVQRAWQYDRGVLGGIKWTDVQRDRVLACYRIAEAITATADRF